MNLLTSCVAIPLVVLGITISNMSTPVSGKKLEITIANDLGNFLNLTVHCVSPAKEYDLGFQVVPYGGRYQWFAHDSSYLCDLAWHKKYGRFLIYESRRDNRRCKGWCFWRIAQEGLYLHLAKPADRDELEFTWD
ncbi:uncharacterized protein LOC125423207 [Ziziphus jujuba]|uniref:S-protein homolog n=1 Tax=Ziziphus jujuba TaxID=326968 RepID=A0ABM3IPN8_ZIZJJ|nr:uncharacterized protein LOC125423207 [Ziziphus jujuba]